MSGIERLQQVERLGPPYFTEQNPIRPVPQRCAEQIRDRDRRQGLLVTERRLSSISVSFTNFVILVLVWLLLLHIGQLAQRLSRQFR